jgi:hypothetical protein
MRGGRSGQPARRLALHKPQLRQTIRPLRSACTGSFRGQGLTDLTGALPACRLMTTTVAAFRPHLNDRSGSTVVVSKGTICGRPQRCPAVELTVELAALVSTQGAGGLVQAAVHEGQAHQRIGHGGESQSPWCFASMRCEKVMFLPPILICNTPLTRSPSACNCAVPVVPLEPSQRRG